MGAINCIHGVLPSMIERQSGAIVSISSDAGRMGEWANIGKQCIPPVKPE